jgi:cathepsin B
MIKFFIVAFVAALGSAKRHPIREELVRELKRTVSWEVHEPETNPLRNFTREQLLKLVSTNLNYEYNVTQTIESTPVDDLPTNFDPRDGTKFSAKCIHPIRDSGNCGSDWVFGAIEALSDRFCFAGKDIVLSPQDPISCDSDDWGCDGGNQDSVWDYFAKTGVVSEACWPYSSGGTGESGICRKFCAVSGESWLKYKCKSGSVIHPTTVYAIKTELYDNGPMEAAINVFEDFFNYKSGVYYHRSGGLAGALSFKMIGWGYDPASGLDYWLCAN